MLDRRDFLSVAAAAATAPLLPPIPVEAAALPQSQLIELQAFYRAEEAVSRLTRISTFWPSAGGAKRLPLSEEDVQSNAFGVSLYKGVSAWWPRGERPVLFVTWRLRPYTPELTLTEDNARRARERLLSAGAPDGFRLTVSTSLKPFSWSAEDLERFAFMRGLV